MLQYVPLPPATAFLVSASGASVTSSLTGVAIGGSAPVWASTPSVSVQATVAGGPVAFSFTGGTPTSVAVEPGDTLPAYFTLSLTGISWNATATAGATYSFRLRASNANGYSTSNIISGTVAAPTDAGIWGTEYDYSAANWRLYRRDGVTQFTVADVPGIHPYAQYNLSICRGKDNDAIYRPSTSRIYTGMGDSAVWNINADGFTTGQGLSNNCNWVSFSTAQPTWITRESGYPNSQSEMYAQLDDCQAVMHDSVNDRMLFFSSSTFGNEWNESVGNGYLGDPIISPVTLVNSTTARFASTTAAVPVGTKLKFLMTVGANANVMKRGRVTSVTDVGGGQIEVVLNWWDTLTTFQNPTGVVVSRSDAAFAPRHGTPTGAWQEANLDNRYYNEAANTWSRALLTMDYSTRLVSRLLFAGVSGRSQVMHQHSAMFLPPSATGRGAEVWGFSGGYFQGMTKYDFATMTATSYSTGLGDSSSNEDAVRTNKGCHDGRGNIYFTGPKANPANLIVVNVRGATPTVTYKATNYPGRMIQADAGNFSMVSYRMVWNEEIQRIELYAIENGGTVVDGNCTIYLIDPNTTPAKVERVGNKDANGRNISGSTVVHVPTTGASPAHTWMMGGAGENAPEATSRSRIFIAANRRKWEALDAGPHWYQSFTPFNPKATDDSTSYSQISQIPEPCFGHWVPETDSSGYNTGKVFIRAGGDGNYGGNEVTILRMDQITGTTYNTQLNTVSSSLDAAGAAAAFAQWHQRIRTGFQSGGTTAAGELLINPANPAEWAPVSIHTQFLNSYVPGYGYVEDWISPASLSTSGVRHTRSAYRAAMPAVLSSAINDNSYPDGNWGNSYGMAQVLGGVSFSLNFWSDAGGNAGKWQRAFISSTGGRRRLACFNPTRNVLLGYTEDSGGAATFYEWTPGAADFTNVKYFTGPADPAITNNPAGWEYAINAAGSNASSIWWVEGDDYLIYRRTYGSAAANGFMRYNRATKTLTALRTTTGSAILDAHFGAGKEGLAVINREARQIIWVLQSAQSTAATLTLYRSSFDDWMNLRPVYVANSTQTFNLPNQIETVGLKSGFVFNGQLYLMSRTGTNYGLNLSAAKVHRLPIY